MEEFLNKYSLWRKYETDNLVFFGYGEDDIFGNIQNINDKLYLRIQYHKGKKNFYETFILNDLNKKQIEKAIYKCIDSYQYNLKLDKLKKIINLTKLK